MKHLVALVMIAFLLPTAVPTVVMAKDNPCKQDKQKFCKGLKAKGGELRACLREHKAEISAACQAFVDTPPAGHQPPKKRQGEAEPATQPEAAAPGQTETPAEEPVPGAENAPE